MKINKVIKISEVKDLLQKKKEKPKGRVFEENIKDTFDLTEKKDK